VRDCGGGLVGRFGPGTACLLAALLAVAAAGPARGQSSGQSSGQEIGRAGAPADDAQAVAGADGEGGAAPAGSGEAAAAGETESPVMRFLSGLPLIGRYFGDGEPTPTGGRVKPHYVLEVDAPEPVAKLIREYTLLGRWRQRADYDPSQLPLFIRRAPGEVRELLEAEGYFSGDASVRVIEGGVRVEVTAGPRATVNRADVVLHGEVQAPGNEALRERIRRDWLLPEGAFFRSPDWDKAKRQLLDGLRDAGFLRAQIRDSEAIVDLERSAASLRVDVESGRPVLFGDLRIEGLKRYPPTVVEGLRHFERGDPYDARDILLFQTRLNGAGWFTAVNVRPDTQALERDPSLETVPIRVDVVERQAKRWALGAGYDTDHGFSVLAGWEGRNIGGLGIQTFNGVELDQKRQVAYSTWETPQDLDGRRWQFGLRAEHQDIQNDLVDAGSVFVSLNRRRGDIETATSLQFQTERQSVVFAPGSELLYDNRALVLGWSWTQRSFDSPIYPTRGYVLSGQVSGASEALGSLRSFTRAYGFGLVMIPLSARETGEFGRLVLRGELGTVFAGGSDGIPSTNLFRTGGSKSVRGYSSQSLGVDVGQATVGGRYLAVVSAEYQHLITRDFAVATFYDLGNAADSLDALKPVAGWGIGARWRTPVGPLNLDLARGQETRDWRLHFSIGVVF
jgi:translocation and assembly module TamA